MLTLLCLNCQLALNKNLQFISLLFYVYHHIVVHVRTGSLNIAVFINLMIIVSISGETCQISFVHFCRLRLGFNQIKSVENGSFVSIPNVREIHLDNNRLRKVPPGLSSLRYLQVRYRHRYDSGTVICVSKVSVTKWTDLLF